MPADLPVLVSVVVDVHFLGSPMSAVKLAGATMGVTAKAFDRKRAKDVRSMVTRVKGSHAMAIGQWFGTKALQFDGRADII